MRYPEAVNLPFNMTILANRFCWVHPGVTAPQGVPLWVLLRSNELIVAPGAAVERLVTGTLPRGLELEGEAVCFGTWDGRPLVAGMVVKDQSLPEGLSAEPFNALEDRLDDLLLTLGGLAQSVLGWLRNACYCSRCAQSMVPIPGSWGRRCPGCQLERFPAVHPCAIVLVRRGEEFLLVRKAAWPAGRYSLVAGFLDLGESLEECAIREVLEETGIKVKNVRYVGSQHWPFPSQLMAGFVADYAGGDLQVDGDELEDARWFSIQEMPAALPSRRSIARWITDRFAVAG